MGNEAREILEMAGKGTAQDDGYAAQCIMKWHPLLKPQHKADPINDPYIKRCTAIMMENQADHMRRHLNEDTISSNAGYYQKHIFPVLRRTFPNMITNQIVSTQPLTGPFGGVFYFERRYQDRKGTKIPAGGIADTVYSTSYDGALAANDNMVQNFAKNYSSEYVDYDLVCADTGTTPATLTNASANCRLPEWGPIRANGTSGQRTFSVTANYQVLDNAGTGTVNIVATMNNSGNFIDNQATPATVGTFNTTTGAWTLNAYDETGAASTFISSTGIYLTYYTNWELVGQTSGAKIPSINLNIASYEVKAEKRALRATWSVDALEDMEAQHGIEAQKTIDETFALETQIEIDRTIIGELIDGAAHTTTYTYAATTPGEIESIRRLITQIGAMSARIAKTTGRSQANFIVVGPAVENLLDQLSTHGDYASTEGADIRTPSYGLVSTDFGVSRVGTLRKKWAVYMDPYMDETKILVGLKGKAWYDSGYVFAPYVALRMTPAFLDPDTQEYKKGSWTRFATKMLRSEYYGVITVSGLPTVTTTL